MSKTNKDFNIHLFIIKLKLTQLPCSRRIIVTISVFSAIYPLNRILYPQTFFEDSYCLAQYFDQVVCVLLAIKLLFHL